MSQKLAISEVFYSIQGEGKTVGIPSVFVRLGGCNLMCGGMGTQFDGELHNGAEFRCDTVEVWMQAQSKEVEEVLCDEMLYCYRKWCTYNSDRWRTDNATERVRGIYKLCKR